MRTQDDFFSQWYSVNKHESAPNNRIVCVLFNCHLRLGNTNAADLELALTDRCHTGAVDEFYFQYIYFSNALVYEQGCMVNVFTDEVRWWKNIVCNFAGKCQNEGNFIINKQKNAEKKNEFNIAAEAILPRCLMYITKPIFEPIKLSKFAHRKEKQSKNV